MAHLVAPVAANGTQKVAPPFPGHEVDFDTPRLLPEGAGRVGIATGVVVVGDLVGEGAAQEHAVVGTTPNLAARLQAEAGPGQVIIAAGTRRLLGTGFILDAISERRLKGHERPLPLFRV